MDSKSPLEDPVMDAQTLQSALLFGGYIVAGITVIIVLVCLSTLNNTLRTPKAPKGWADHDYDGEMVANRKAMSSDIADLPLNRVSVATANFGGIFTEETSLTNPWIGTVSPEAVTLQVAAGARAIVFDIWPDPADPKTPVVASMVDTSQWWAQSFWRNFGGLNQGVGRYSNWQLLTRNTVPLVHMLSAAFQAAFQYSNGPQNTDPFFIFLKFHGAYTPDHFNAIGNFIQQTDSINQYTMDAAPWMNANNQRAVGQTKLSEFANKAFITVIPEIQSGYQILPGVLSYDAFVNAFLKTGLAQYTNAIERTPASILFDPSNLAAAQSPTQPSPLLGGTPITPIETGLCLIQPSPGGQTTDNAKLFNGTSYTAAVGTGASFVAVNLFSPNKSDPAMGTYMDPAYFGSTSFRATS